MQRSILISLALIACGLLAAAPASARSSYCSSTGDYCTSVARTDGKRMLRLGTFSFRGRVDICVNPPRGKTTCRHPKLRATSAGLYEAATPWHGAYRYHGHGIYKVTFAPAGADQLGPTLSFRG